LDVGLGAWRPEGQIRAPAVILLDTSAVIWVEQNHRRIRPLLRSGQRLYVSPATLLELQFLQEAGRIRLIGGTVQTIVADERWTVDDPPATAWFTVAADSAWSRDPFDRLLAAHAQLRRWRLATSDAGLISRLGPGASLEL
jgi:PIN domain nuclease of toxin-antitoxin system